LCAFSPLLCCIELAHSTFHFAALATFDGVKSVDIVNEKRPVGIDKALQAARDVRFFLLILVGLCSRWFRLARLLTV
jgi:hypothetical protein